MSDNKNHKTGLLFGSFNPIHIGHLIIADYYVQCTDINEIWFIVSPQNPFKINEKLLDEKTRLHLVKLATEDNSHFYASDIEFSMEQPSFTYKTLEVIKNNYPDKDFVLIIGSDNLAEFEKWKNYNAILSKSKIYVYPRPGYNESRFDKHPSVKLTDAPIFEISSTYIRQYIKTGKDTKYLLPEKVYKEIISGGYYRD